MTGKLPAYFLADLPAEASVSSPLIAGACRTLKRNRELYLAGRSTESLIAVLADAAEDWLKPDYPLRKLALELGPEQTSFEAPTIAAGLDGFFRQLTRGNLWGLIAQDLGHPGRLDAMVATEEEKGLGRAAMATGPELVVHIAAGNLPNPAWMSLVLGILARSAQFVKCASGASLLPRLFAHSLYERDGKLGACFELAEWPGGQTDLEQELFDHADCVTAIGTDETLRKIRERLPERVRFVTYGHRVSFAYITRAALADHDRLIVRAADDVTAWNQLGCLSPHVVYVEPGGRISPEKFAELLAEELECRERHEPRGRISTETAAHIAYRRAFYEIRTAGDVKTRLWQSQDSTAWTLVFEDAPLFQTSCLNRFVYVKATTDLTEALQQSDAFRGRVSTVGLAALPGERKKLATQLARWGVTRICELGRMQNPSLLWRHDGRPALGELVTWTDWEGEGGGGKTE